MNHSRRTFLAEVGRGMLVAGVGAGLAEDLGLATARAADGPDRLTFGPLEPLVGLMQDTPPAKLLPLLVERLRGGATLRELTGAAALANARAFGGEDYTGYHTLMALAPAYHMAGELPAERAPLAVLKVIYRNSSRLQERGGGHAAEVLHPVAPADTPATGEALRDAVRRKDKDAAERSFAAIARGSAADAFDHLLIAVEDGLDVHRIVLPYRAWMLLDVVGPEHAHTLLRQSVRYCADAERQGYGERIRDFRALLPKLFDQHRLAGRPLGKRTADDAWVDRLSQTIFQSTPEQAAGAAAAALAEGFDPEAVGEAVALATNQLVLRDAGRPENQAAPGKPPGSVHGDSIGVHACDAANAWRGMARVSSPRNTAACLILAAYKAADDRGDRGGDFLHWQPRPWAEHTAALRSTDPAAVLKEADDAIRANAQGRACAAVARFGAAGGDARRVFDLLLRYAVSEDGSLHAEKYYRTVTEEFAASRPAFRWRQLVALARVTASEYGRPAAGVAEAGRLLGV